MHNDDISNVLILNKKAVQNHENALFANELEKFRPHQNRLLQAAHKQSALMKDLTAAYGDLLQDKRIRSEQSRYEALSRSRNAILSKFKKSYQAYLDICEGLDKARQFYSDMTETAQSLDKNVETFVSNRRSEGAMLLSQIENQKGTDAELQQRRIKDMMERVTLGSGGNSPDSSRPPGQHHTISPTAHTMSPPTTPRYPPHQYPGVLGAPTPPPPPPSNPPPSAGFTPAGFGQYHPHPAHNTGRRDSHGQLPGLAQRPGSYAPHQAPLPSPGFAPPNSQYYQGHYQQPGAYAAPPTAYQAQPYNPSTYVPPPPPPGPPPPGRQSYGGPLPQTTYQPTQQQPQPGHPGAGDPFAGLSGWK